jgi:hypothetical protein
MSTAPWPGWMSSMPTLILGWLTLSVVILAHRFRTKRLLTFDERGFRAITIKPATGTLPDPTRGRSVLRPQRGFAQTIVGAACG